MQGDHVIFELLDGRMVKVGSPTGNPESANFLIVCDYGDWSGFRTLTECMRQFPELERNGRPNHFYQVVERF